MRELFLAFLGQHDDEAWQRIADRLGGSIHPVDRAATRIWFHFYPLALEHAVQGLGAVTVARRATLAGRWRLVDQIDRSHSFLFGHQFWPQVKQAVLAYAAAPTSPGSLDLGAQIHEVAALAAASAQVRADLLLGMTAIGLRTLQQVGPDALAASPGDAVAPGLFAGRTADQVWANRRRAGGQGLLGFLRGTRKHWTVTFDERLSEARFPLIESQHLTTAAALDRRQYRTADSRCSEGPIPVQCRSCSCGTCWVGVLRGVEVLSAMDQKERQKLAECGVALDESHPPIRLACQAQAFGPVSIVIPPWNGLVGRVRSPAQRHAVPRD